MSQKEWGNITWLLFHSLAEKIDDNSFSIVKDQLIYFIKYTCENSIPCPIQSESCNRNIKKWKYKFNK